MSKLHVIVPSTHFFLTNNCRHKLSLNINQLCFLTGRKTYNKQEKLYKCFYANISIKEQFRERQHKALSISKCLRYR